MLPTALLLATLSAVGCHASKKKTKRHVYTTLAPEPEVGDVTLEFFTGLGGEVWGSLTRPGATTLEVVTRYLFPDMQRDQEVKFVVGTSTKSPATTFKEAAKAGGIVMALLMDLPEPDDEELELLRGAPDYFRQPGKLKQLVRSRRGWDRRLRETQAAWHAEVDEFPGAPYVNFLAECPALRQHSAESESAIAHIIETEPEVLFANPGQDDGTFEMALIYQRAYARHGPLYPNAFRRLVKAYPEQAKKYKFLRPLVKDIVGF